MKRKIAFILTGGGTKGAFQIGALKELIKRGIEPDAIFSTSVGAINSIMFLASKNLKRNLEIAEEEWENIGIFNLFRLNPEILYKFIFAKSIYSQKGLKKLLKKFLKRDNFSTLSKKLYILATNHSNGDPKFFSKGKLIEKVLASCAIPGAFPPQKIKGKFYIDGGLSGYCGIKKAEELGYDIIILLNLNSDSPKKIGPMGAELAKSCELLIQNTIEEEIKDLKTSRILEIRTGKASAGKGMNFKIIKKLLRNGEIRTKRALDKHKIFSKKDLYTLGKTKKKVKKTPINLIARLLLKIKKT